MIKKIFIFLVFTIALIGCDNDLNSDVIGIWVGSYGGITVTVDITNTGWSLSTSNNIFFDNGTYEMKNSVSADLYSTKYNSDVGTVVIVNRNTIELTLNSNSVAAGKHILNRF